jgi:hypothetical protein
MKTAHNLSTASPQRAPSWPPMPAAASPAVDTNHWLSRAARGFTWNRDGVSPRRRPN